MIPVSLSKGEKPELTVSVEGPFGKSRLVVPQLKTLDNRELTYEKGSLKGNFHFLR